MTRVLTVDDSETIRAIVSKQLGDLGYEVVEAEDGESGLARLEAEPFDVVLLDVSMPGMDGPTMLKAMRDRGDRTPVVLVTSESKRATVTEAVKSGIADYILKPFQPEELEAKVKQAMQAEGAESDTASATAREERETVDILLIDSKENVARRLRGLLPERLGLEHCKTSSEGLSHCREKNFRAIFIDRQLPSMKPSVFAGQLRTLQPDALLVTMVLRTDTLTIEAANSQGFDGLLHKPFDVDEIEELLLRHFKIQEVVSVDDNLLTVLPFSGKEDRLKRYLTSLKELMYEQFPEIASACFEHVLLDFTRSGLAEGQVETLAPMLSDARDATRKMGLELRVVGNEAFRSALSGNTKTASLPAFDSLDAARAE